MGTRVGAVGRRERVGMMSNLAPLTPIGLRPLLPYGHDAPNGKNRHLWEEIAAICEGVKQIGCCWGNKNIFFTSCGGENDLHTFTNVFSGGALVCGATEKTHPQLSFRVAGGHEYCVQHLPAAK